MPDSAPLTNAQLTAKGAEPQVTTGPFPASRKTFMAGRLPSDIRGAMREIVVISKHRATLVRSRDSVEAGPGSLAVR